VRALGNYFSEGIADKGSAPEFEPVAGSGFSADVAGFKAYTIHDRDIDAVGNRMRALNRAPGVMLGDAEFGLLRWMPADCGGIEQDRCALERGEASTFGKPLIPADERAQATSTSVEGTESEVAGSEIKFFVIERIVGDVHLAVEAA
jgi:hypothetical protein